MGGRRGRVCRAERKEDKYLHGRQRGGTEKGRSVGRSSLASREIRKKIARRTPLFVSTLTQ